MKNVFKKAHELTKKIIKLGDSYRATFKLALIFVYSQIRKGVKVMVELKGTEKQIKYANDIRDEVLRIIPKAIDFYEELQNKNFEKRGKINKIYENNIKRLIPKVENEINTQEDAGMIIFLFKNILIGEDYDKIKHLLICSKSF
jgi:hypothetical protein